MTYTIMREIEDEDPKTQPESNRKMEEHGNQRADKKSDRDRGYIKLLSRLSRWIRKT